MIIAFTYIYAIILYIDIINYKFNINIFLYMICYSLIRYMGFLCGTSGKEPAC